MNNELNRNCSTSLNGMETCRIFNKSKKQYNELQNGSENFLKKEKDTIFKGLLEDSQRGSQKNSQTCFETFHKRSLQKCHKENLRTKLSEIEVREDSDRISRITRLSESGLSCNISTKLIERLNSKNKQFTKQQAPEVQSNRKGMRQTDSQFMFSRANENNRSCNSEARSPSNKKKLRNQNENNSFSLTNRLSHFHISKNVTKRNSSGCEMFSNSNYSSFRASSHISNISSISPSKISNSLLSKKFLKEIDNVLLQNKIYSQNITFDEMEIVMSNLNFISSRFCKDKKAIVTLGRDEEETRSLRTFWNIISDNGEMNETISVQKFKMGLLALSNLPYEQYLSNPLQMDDTQNITSLDFSSISKISMMSKLSKFSKESKESKELKEGVDFLMRFRKQSKDLKILNLNRIRRDLKRETPDKAKPREKKKPSEINKLISRLQERKIQDSCIKKILKGDNSLYLNLNLNLYYKRGVPQKVDTKRLEECILI